MRNDLVSVVIPAYNASNYLAEAIDSALAQTYKNIEIIVVNDGSPDDGKTREVALSYGDKIRYFEKENGGCASALNFGMDVMQGEWFSWLSHDDLYCPEKIERMLEAIDENGLSEDTVLVCDTILVNGEGEEMPCPFRQTRGFLSSEQAFGETLNVKTFNGCGMLIPKKVIDETGRFITEYKHLLDREYWMRIAINGHPYFVIDESLVKSRAHNAQVTVKQSDLLFGEEEKMISEYFDIITKENKSDGFAKGLCIFAYKRRHYKSGKMIKKYLSSRGALTLSDRKNILYYTAYGKLRVLFGNVYRKLIRR